jgi:hypothetical protein
MTGPRVEGGVNGEQALRIGASIVFAPVLAAVFTVHYFFLCLVEYGKCLASGMGVGRNAEPAALPTVPKKPDDGREPAYKQYLFGQLWTDVRQIGRLAWRYQRKSLHNAFEKRAKARFSPETETVDANVPFGVAYTVALALGFTLATVVLGAVVALQAAASAALMLLCLGLIYLLRAVDTGLLQVRGIRITCSNPKDYGRVPYPSYKCKNCGAMHHDVRPGRYGVVERTCACGGTMPTLLMLGSHRMPGYCPKCHEPLPPGSGEAPEIVLPVFGASNAGKTQLMVLLAQAAQERFERTGATVEPGDDYTRDWIKEQSKQLSSTGRPQKTGTELRPPYVLRMRTGRRRRRTLKIFDVAGEIFDTSERIDGLRYATAARTFVFVLDPLAIGKFWASLDEDVRSRLDSVRSVREPHNTFVNATLAFERMDLDLKKIRLMVAVSKADLISSQLEQAGVDGDPSIRTWLREDLDLGNMVQAMIHRFANVEFVLTAAVRHGDTVDDSVIRFMDSVLAGEGVK